MTPAPDTSRAEAAPSHAGIGPEIPIQGRCDRAIRHRLRGALEREPAVATAAGDEAARTACRISAINDQGMTIAANGAGRTTPRLHHRHPGFPESPHQASPKIRVVVGSSDPLGRVGIAQALHEARIDVLATASNGTDLRRKVQAHHPDLTVIDLDPESSSDGQGGVETVRGIRSIDPPVPVLVLSRHADERYVLEVVGDQPQGFGFLVKERIGEVEHFTASARRVACGGTAIDPVVISRMARFRPTDDRLEDLTARERQVLALMAEGRTNSFIASKLVVTIPAIERHITSIFAKLSLRPNRDDHRRVLAVLRYLGRLDRSASRGQPHPPPIPAPQPRPETAATLANLTHPSPTSIRGDSRTAELVPAQW